MNNIKQTLRNYGINRKLTFIGIEKTAYLTHTKVNVIFEELTLSCFVLNYMINKIDLIDRTIFSNLYEL